MALLATYARAWREEPKLRAYLMASVVDDIGVAAVGWAGVLLMVNLFKDQRARASVMLPSLVCFLVGALVAGPLADWERSAERIGTYRWKLVVWGRLIEALGLGSVVLATARGPTIANILPYMLLSALMKTGLGPTRDAYFVDLLQREEVRVDAGGAPMHAQHGRPLTVKSPLLTSAALVRALRAGSALLGLLAGGVVARAVHQRYEVLFAIDIGTTLVFIAVVATTCHPRLSRHDVRLRELLAVRPDARGAGAIFSAGVRHFFTSLRELVRYLRVPEVRPLLWILFGNWLVECLDEFYSGDMIVKHTLHGSDDDLRYARIAWAIAAVVALALIPALSRRMGGLGRIFIGAMLLDGLVMAVAGQVAMSGSARPLVPFAAVLTLDRALVGSGTATDTLGLLATASAASATIRGRVLAVVPVAAILGDMLAEALSTPISERYGVPAMVRGLGVVQIALMLAVAVAGGSAFWRYGIRSRQDTPSGAT